MNENNEHIITVDLHAPLSEAAQKRLAALETLRDEDIDYSDIPPLFRIPNRGQPQAITCPHR